MDQTIQKVQISAQFVEKDSTNQRISNVIYYLTHRLNRTNAIFAIGVSRDHAASIKYLIDTTYHVEKLCMVEFGNLIFPV